MPEHGDALARLRDEMRHVPLCPVTPCTCQRFADLALVEAERDALLADAKLIVDAFAAGLFVRSTKHDDDPTWAMKLVRPLSALARFAVLTEPAPMTPPAPGVTQADQADKREATIRATHAELHAGPCSPDGPSVICVLLARLATLEREREALREALQRAPDQFRHAERCATRDSEATTRPGCTCGVDALLAIGGS